PRGGPALDPILSDEDMNTHDALLQAIIESPDDDTPRLVYADYLEEHGQTDRAEFIRVQLDLARLPDSPDSDERREALAAREQALLKKYGEQWAYEVLSPVTGMVTSWWFRRGFLNELQ